ncbi:MAG TPA: type II secretion system protein [Verrucomicrobiae bacterium]|nr:type II secretion system protein [Verrucomicrobiae bacterium]
MKTEFHPSPCEKIRRQRGFLQVDLLVALAILAIAIVPLGFSFERERHLLRIEYCRSVADEIVDGEMEILIASNAKNLPDGSQIYPIHSIAADHLPPGHFQLTHNERNLRLEWLPDKGRGYHPVVREITLK